MITIDSLGTTIRVGGQFAVIYPHHNALGELYVRTSEPGTILWHGDRGIIVQWHVPDLRVLADLTKRENSDGSREFIYEKIVADHGAEDAFAVPESGTRCVLACS